MARKDHCGNRKARKNMSTRIPDLGYYYVVTDTDATESNYVNGLRDSLPREIKNRIVIKVVKSRTVKLVETCKEQLAINPQYAEPWIIFDRDQVVGFDEIIASAEKAGINVGWSNPCFEIWLDAYFGKMHSYSDSVSCCKGFATTFEKNVGIKYKKSNERLYRLLSEYGDENKAIEIANNNLKKFKSVGTFKPSEMYPCTTVQNFVGKIRKSLGTVSNND